MRITSAKPKTISRPGGWFFTEKIKMLDNYIQQLNQAVASNDIKAAEDLQHEIISVYNQEIDGIKTGLNNYSAVLSMSKSVDFIRDARILKSKLENYKFNLLSGLYEKFGSRDNAIKVTQSVQQQTNNNISISLEQTVSGINSLPQESLSDEDKEILCGKLATLSAEKSKESKWEKAQSVLKWIAEKGFEVGKIALPYVLQTVFNTPA